MEQVLKKSTAFSIVRRFAPVGHLDQNFVIAGGHVAESGTPTNCKPLKAACTGALAALQFRE